jgi:hypothetical protein
VDELTAWSRDLTVEVGARSRVAHRVRSAAAAADRTGLTGALSRALRRRGFTPVRDRGRVLADTAVLIADGGRVLSGASGLPAPLPAAGGDSEPAGAPAASRSGTAVAAGSATSGAAEASASSVSAATPASDRACEAATGTTVRVPAAVARAEPT